GWQPPDARTCIAKRTLEILERVADRRDDARSGHCDAPLSHRSDSAPAAGGKRGGDVPFQVAERLDALQVLIGDADSELFLDLEHEFDEGERVDAELVERRSRVERLRVEREFLAGQLLDARERVHRRAL